MDPKIVEEIFDYTTQTWKDLKDTTPQLMRQAISNYNNKPGVYDYLGSAPRPTEPLPTA
ncbi:Uncharacterized protein APZ42_006302 [Daphnia magna]|uniref:Uncharacterized protein n=1 Tax=Daphnia magna TaxID=35525 RepID=A0A162D3R8_9CRUS|nr:Uncharacterized protein APZ42_006302 [Daphnia magna]